MNSFFKISHAIKKAKRIAVFTHTDPDPDAIGSALSLTKALKKLKKTVDLYISDKFTDSESAIFDTSDVLQGACDPHNYDLMITTDVPSVFRLGSYGEVVSNFENTIVLDHHMNVDLLGRYAYINTDSSSCCEIVFALIRKLGIKVDKEIATYLYAGLSSDTNSFTNSNVNVKSFKNAFYLLKLGANVNEINEKQYKMRSKKEIIFRNYLWNNYVQHKDAAYILIDRETLKKLKGSKEDCNNFSTELVSINGINYGISVIEVEDKSFYISMRSKVGYDVRRVATELGGGGHLCAAATTLGAKSINSAKNKVLRTLFKNKGEKIG